MKNEICQDNEQHGIHLSVVGADVVLENTVTVYNVSEDEGVAEVCAVVSNPVIDCPIEVPFNFFLYTRDGSAGMEFEKFFI